MTMATPDDNLVILYTPDGELWANFLSGRLNGPNYNIKSILKPVPQITDSASSKETFPGSSTNKASRIPSGFRDSGRGSRIPVNDPANILEDTENAKARVVLVSPDTLLVQPFPFDVSQMNPKRSVFLLLAVEIEDVRKYFDDKSDAVFKCRCCIIHSDEKSVLDAMVQIIEAYEESDSAGSGVMEDDHDIYQIPRSPRQLNSIERVFPREVTEKDRDVFILLERQAEEDLMVALDGFNQEIPLNQLEGRLYTFTLPDNVKGEIYFSIKCKNHLIGEDSIQAFTKLDKIKAILDEEVSPMSVLASAMVLPTDDLEDIDQTLASKLRQLSSVSTFKKMFPIEDSLNNSVTDERADVLYPSLLHFAADYNLRKLCSVLLCYPAMLSAATTENRNGDFPSMMASKKGYVDLESDLIHFIQDQKLESSDSHSLASEYNELYVQPSPPVDLASSAPRPHGHSKSPHYINDQPPTDGYYVLTNDRKPLSGSAAQFDPESLSPMSNHSDDVFIPSTYLEVDEDDLDPEIQFSRNVRSGKVLKVFGVREEDILRSATSTPDRGQTSSQNQGRLTQPNSITHGMRYPAATRLPPEADRLSVSSNCEDPALYGIYQQDTKQKARNKIAAFFGKIKNKRSPSEGEINYVNSRSPKKIPIPRTKSDRAAKTTVWPDSTAKKKSTEDSNQERDSGSYSDDENHSKRRSRPKEFKERDKQMTRRKSKRVQMASRDHVQDAPHLPVSRRTGTFTSFIENP